MKLKAILILLVLPLLSHSALSESGYNIYYEIDSLRNVKINATLFISSADLVYLRESDSLYKAGYTASLTLLRKDKSPIKSFYADSTISRESYKKAKEDSIIEQRFIFPSDSMTAFISLEILDRNSSNKFNTILESNPPKVSEHDSYIIGADFLENRDGRFFANDTIELLIKSIITDSSSYSINLIVQNSDKKVVFKKKFRKNVSQEDTVSLTGDFYGGIYKVTIELIKDKKKVSVINKDFSVEFSFINSESEFSDIVSALSFIGKWDDIDKIRKADNEDRERVWNDFWFKQQYHPEISSYVSCLEFFERYEYANKYFTGYKKGYKTDFGRIHIMYGKPDEIERHPFDTDSKPYEIWYYWSLGYEFLFMDERGYGEYTLKNYMEQLR
ncbi:MAG: GWxTD domain-containing protein [bacterium]|nr:GWxTD domain-containing protein [bacterium]